MSFFEWKSHLVRVGLILVLLLSSSFLSACSEDGENRTKAGTESTADPVSNPEEGQQRKQWNKMNWNAGNWG